MKDESENSAVERFNNSMEHFNKSIERLKNTIPSVMLEDHKQQDIQIVDKVLTSLYNDGDKIILSLQEDILKPNNVLLNEKDSARMWDILTSSGMVHAVIGFGNTGKLDLSNVGYQLMNEYGSYSAYLEAKQKQAQQQSQGMVFPQFIIEQSEEGEPTKEGEEKEVDGKKKDADKK